MIKKFLFVFIAFWSVNSSAVQFIKDIQISPDNQSALLTVIHKTSVIYKASIKGNQPPIPISSMDDDAFQPNWSPDGNWISYLSQNTLVLTNTKCNETRTLNAAMQTYRWSPDSSKIAFVHQNRLWIIDITNNQSTSTPLTPLSYCVRGYGDFGSANVEFDWAPKGNEIVFAYSPSSSVDDCYLTSSLAKINLDTGAIMPFEKKCQHESMPNYSPDGQSIAFLASGTKATYAFNKYVHLCSADGTNRRQLASTFNEGPLFVGPSLLGWSQDGQQILLYEPKGTKYHIEMIPIDGGPAKELATGKIFFKEPALSPDRSLIGFVGQDFNSPPEAFVANLIHFQPKQLSHFNVASPPIETEIIEWKSMDGLAIEGILSYPSGYQKGKKYPLLLIIHGGPMSFHDQSYLGLPFVYPVDTFAKAGFFVLRPNPRGSTGYGKKFRWLNHRDLGGKDYEDLISGVDALIDRGMVDPKRLGVMGWSYGGYMTAWIISQTNRFKAASIGAGISNWLSMAGTSDVPHLVSDYLGSYWENPDLYHKRSPLFHVPKVETPCLIQHGSEDRRVSVCQSYEYERALKSCGKEVKLVVYPRMGHSSSEPE